jgi:hypothetical protein
MPDYVMRGIPAKDLPQFLEDLGYQGYDGIVSADGNGGYTVRAVPKAAAPAPTPAAAGPAPADAPPGAEDGEAGSDEEEAPGPGTAEPLPVADDATVTASDPGTEGGDLILTEAHLIALWKRSLFPFESGQIVVFGMRSCLPVDYAGTSVAPSHPIGLTSLDYRTMRCTLGQWRPGSGFSLFPGSTVPYGGAVAAAVPRGGKGVNQLGRGRYLNYIAGWHKRAEGPRGHWALLQDCAITLQRTADDTEYDEGDRWEVGRIAGDNIHCAFGMGPGAAIPDARYSSLGCQVVAGTVRKGAEASERGPWAKFIDAFRRDGGETRAEYVLFDGLEVQQMIRTQCRGKSVILRMGSQGDLVTLLQRRLAAKLGRAIETNGTFGVQTFLALTEFQAKTLGPNNDDGIAGPETAAALDFALPDFDFTDAISGGSGIGPAGGASAAAGQLVGEAQLVAGGAAGGVAPADGPPIAWGAVAAAKAGPGFKAEVLRISKRLGCDPNHLMAVMAFESGNSFAPDKPNAAGSGAIGLIQFMPQTAKSLGTTSNELAKMTAAQQLSYVEKYISGIKGNKSVATLNDLYMSILWPAAVGKLDSFILFSSPSSQYKQNKGLDTNNDGVITKAEAASKVQARLVAGLSVGKIG